MVFEEGDVERDVGVEQRDVLLLHGHHVVVFVDVVVAGSHLLGLGE